MPHRPVFIISDVHLGAVPRATELALCQWLEHAGDAASRVVINGDLFDFWFEYGTVIPRGHTRVLGALARLVDGGVPVDFMGGNHDWWADSYLSNEIGLTIHREPVILELAGQRVLLAHGDGLGAGDLGYRMLRLVLRGRATRWAFRWLHPDLGARVARWVSRTEVRGGEPDERELARGRFLRDWAVTRLEGSSDVDHVLLGHSHLPERIEVAPGRFYVNGGDWVRHRTYVVLAPGQAPVLEEWVA
jgi:UDP-2,3-diacylglucosamine hydrolase